MKGNNEFRFNEATMIEIVQQWMNTAFTSAPIVSSVEAASGGYGAHEFVIKVKEPGTEVTTGTTK